MADFCWGGWTLVTFWTNCWISVWFCFFNEFWCFCWDVFGSFETPKVKLAVFLHMEKGAAALQSHGLRPRNAKLFYWQRHLATTQALSKNTSVRTIRIDILTLDLWITFVLQETHEKMLKRNGFRTTTLALVHEINCPRCPFAFWFNARFTSQHNILQQKKVTYTPWN